MNSILGAVRSGSRGLRSSSRDRGGAKQSTPPRDRIVGLPQHQQHQHAAAAPKAPPTDSSRYQGAVTSEEKVQLELQRRQMNKKVEVYQKKIQELELQVTVSASAPGDADRGRDPSGADAVTEAIRLVSRLREAQNEAESR